MTAAAAITLPGSRALPGWWREIGGHSPKRFWFAHLILHRLEAQVEVQTASPLATLAGGLLAMLATQKPPLSVSTVARSLSLDPELVRALARSLVQQGLLEPSPNGQLGPLTEAGHCALNAPPPSSRIERRTFFFLDTRPSTFLPLSANASTPLPPPSGWRFDLAALESCLAQSLEWKRARGFPTNVVRIVWDRSSVTEQSWHSVPLDRPEQCLMLLIETNTNHLVGLNIRSDTWALVREPVLQMPFDEAWIDSLAGKVGIEEWWSTWRAWCQQRSFPQSDVEACTLETRDHRLLVRPPQRLLERLRQARSEALRGETWLLAGTGRARPAALVEIVTD